MINDLDKIREYLKYTFDEVEKVKGYAIHNEIDINEEKVLNTMKTIFLIEGSAGQWDEYHTWIVCGGFDKKTIKSKCDELNQIANDKFERGKAISESAQKDDYDFPINLSDEEMELYEYYAFYGIELFKIIETEVI